MSNKRVARHRAARRPSTPLTQATKALLSSEMGRRSSVLAGSGVALTVIAAGVVPGSTVQANQAIASSVDASKVASAVVQKISTNPQIKAESKEVSAQGMVAVDKAATNRVKKADPVVNREAPAAPATPAAQRPQRPQRQAPPAPNYAVDFNFDAVKGNQIIQIARQYLGIRYRWGQMSPATGFDCSGLVGYVYGQVGVRLPRSSTSIGSVGRRLSLSSAQPGDILWRRGHVGIYIGNGMMIHAPHPGDVVRVAPISHGGFTAAIRIG